MQFSTRQLLFAVFCFAVAFGVGAGFCRLSGDPAGALVWLGLASPLVGLFCGGGIGALAGRFSYGAYAGFVAPAIALVAWIAPLAFA